MLLNQFRENNPDIEFDVSGWISKAQEEELSVRNLKKALKALKDEETEGRKVELFAVNEEKKQLRFRPVKIDSSLTSEQKKELIADLETALEFLKGL